MTLPAKKGSPQSIAGLFVGKDAPWAQRPDEPARAYAIFLKYLQLPVRSLKALMKTMGKKHVPDGLVAVAEKFAWENRGDAWDVYRANLRMEAMERREKKAARAEVESVTNAMLVTAELIRRTKKDVMTNSKTRLGPRDLREWLHTSISLRRLLREQPQSISARVGSKARTELSEKLEQMAQSIRHGEKKAKKAEVNIPVAAASPAPTKTTVN